MTRKIPPTFLKDYLQNIPDEEGKEKTKEELVVEIGILEGILAGIADSVLESTEDESLRDTFRVVREKSAKRARQETGHGIRTGTETDNIVKDTMKNLH